MVLRGLQFQGRKIRIVKRDALLNISQSSVISRSAHKLGCLPHHTMTISVTMTVTMTVTGLM